MPRADGLVVVRHNVPELVEAMAKGDHLGELEHVVLIAVARLEARAHGAAIRREIARALDRDTSLATIYVTLTRLEKKRLVVLRAGPAGDLEFEPGRRVGRVGRPHKAYRVTLEGIMALQAVRIGYARLWQGVSFDPVGTDSPVVSDP